MGELGATNLSKMSTKPLPMQLDKIWISPISYFALKRHPCLSFSLTLHCAIKKSTQILQNPASH